MSYEKVQAIVKKIYSSVRELEEIYPGRHFTPDGHMVGSIGECLVADAYNLKLQTASNKGFDAICPEGRQIEIKATQSKSAAFRSEPQYAIIIKIHPDGSFSEIYNGPGSLVWQHFSGKNLPSNGQFQISINKLAVLNEQVQERDRIKKKA